MRVRQPGAGPQPLSGLHDQVTPSASVSPHPALMTCELR